MVTAEQPPFITRDEFERHANEVNQRFNGVDAELAQLRQGQQQLEQRMIGLEQRMTSLEHRFVDFRDNFDKRFDDFRDNFDKRLDDFTKAIDRRFTMMMWGIGLGGIGVFATLGWIASRIP